ncbi:MAG: flippase-like domain-containing protein [Anaerolineae bacterium]|nr:flippase-like domain-containing protein [Anaerolineae bacterium]
MRRWLTFALGLGISAFFVWLGLRTLDRDLLWETIQSINAAWLGVAAVVYFLATYILAWRWYYLLRPVKPVHPNRLFPIVVIGYMGNNIYPARIGELVRAYILKRSEQINYAPSLATILVERIFDGLVLLSFILMALLFVDFDEPALRTAIYIAVPLFVGALLVFSVLALRPETTRSVYTTIIKRLIPAAALQEKLLHLAAHFMEGLETLRTPRLLLLTWISSVASWTIEASTYWIVLHAFNFTVTFWVLMLAMGFANLTTIIPSAPGYVGSFHLAVGVTLTAFGVSKEDAGAYAVIMHLILWLPVTLVGFFYFIRMGMRWSDFDKATRYVESETPA